MDIPILLQFLLTPTLMKINVGWGQITDAISRLFAGGNFTDPATNITHWTPGILGADPTVIAVVMFLFFLILIGLFGMGFLVGSVVLLPVMFALFQYIPPLRIIVAIVIGIIFGMGLHRIIRR